jgi:cytochrome o ubiquinol oxidase subunit 1
MVAFFPLYALGFMGATRRLDHYDNIGGWQVLFIVAGVGVMIIGLGVALQLLQLGVSIWQRKKNIDTTGDPWNGRTLEWSVPSPAPFYNFAVIPTVTTRDPFWEAKRAIANGKKPQKPVYHDILLPKNTPMGMIIALFACMIGFGLIWYIWWLAIIGLIGVVVSVVFRTTSGEHEYVVPAQEIERLEATYRQKEQLA